MAPAIAITQFASAADWPQYRGPNFNGSTDEKILTSWPQGGPRQIWRRPTLGGFSSFVIVSNHVSTLGLREVEAVPMECCIAFDADTGRELWTRPLCFGKYTGVGDDSGNAGPPNNRGGDGPRSTPAMDDASVYALSARFELFRLDRKTGQIIWSKNLIAELGGSHIPYENAASPVLDGDLLLLAGGGPGQSLLGIDKHDGRIVWKAHDEVATHSTPAVATIDGARQIVFFTRSGLVAVNPKTGENLWHYKFRFRVCAAITPVVADNLVFCSAGYGVGSAVSRVSKSGRGFAVTEVWRRSGNEPVCSYWSTPIHRDGYLYGMFGFKKYNVAPMKCVDMATGAVKWSHAGFGHGNVIQVGDLLLALTGYGTLVLINPDPSEYREVARASILTGKCWSMPILSNGRLYARSTKEAVCLDLSPPHQLPATAEISRR